MKLKIIIWSLLLAFSALLASSCVKEDLIGKEKLPESPEGTVRLELFTNATGYETPTRMGSAQEDTVDPELWILVFKGEGDGAVFSEAQRAFVLGGRSYVNLSKTDSRSRLLIIANATRFHTGGIKGYATFTAENLEEALAGSTFGDAVGEILVTTMFADINLSVPYTAPSSPIPMSGEYTVNRIDNATTVGSIGNEVVLKRIVAKATVSNRAANFSLQGAMMINAPRNGLFYRPGDMSLKDNSGNLCVYMDAQAGAYPTDIAPAVNESTGVNPLYLYESGTEDEASVIIRGIYQGTGYYYRLRFTGSNGIPMDVLRNKHYQFLINSVSGRGYGSPEEAEAAPPSNVISYDIKVTDQVSHEIVDNGQYYLGISNSVFSASVTNEEALSGDLIALTVQSDAPAGLNLELSVMNTQPSYTSFSANAELVSTQGGIRKWDIKVAFPSSEDLVMAYLNIRIGNISKTVLIVRGAALSAEGKNLGSLPNLYFNGILDYGMGNCVLAEVTSQGNGGDPWLSLRAVNNGNFSGNAGTRITPDTPCQGIAPVVTPNIGLSVYVRKGGEFYYSCEKGRIKIAISQECEEYTEYPNSISSRFARSNIVLKDGKLTFAITRADNATIPSNVQGLFFRWGSLVGVSSTGANGTKFAAGHIVFSPSELSKPTTWAGIPYISDAIETGYDVDGFSKVCGETGYNASAGIGDICRYISDQPEWKAAGKGKWRMPVAAEYRSLYNETTKKNVNIGSFSYETIDRADGTYGISSGLWLGAGVTTETSSYDNKVLQPDGTVFFPSAGYRSISGDIAFPGYDGVYWSTSPSSSDNAYYLYFRPDGSSPNMSYVRSDGHSVRCIRDK